MVSLLCQQPCCDCTLTDRYVPLALCFFLSSCLSCRTSQRRQSNVRVLGLQRPLFVVLLGAAALYCLYRSGGWLRLLLVLLAGDSDESDSGGGGW